MTVPQLNGEITTCGAKGVNESVLEGSDSLLHGINPVVVGLNQ